MNHSLLQWMSDNPGLSVLLSCPTLLLLIGTCWSVAGVINNGITQSANLVVALLNAIVILFRGHVPISSQQIQEQIAEAKRPGGVLFTPPSTDTRDDSPSSGV